MWTNFNLLSLNRLSFHIYRDGDLKKTRDSWGTIWQREISSVYPLLTLMNCNWGLFTLVKNGDSTGPTKYQTRFPFRLMLVSPWTEKSPINYFLKQIKFCLNLKENAKISKFTFAGCEVTRIIGMFVSCQWQSPSRETICFGLENSIGALYIILLHGHPLSTVKNIFYWLTWKEIVHSDIHDPWLILRLRFSQFSQTDRYRFIQEVLNTERYLSRNSILRPISITTHFYRPQRSWGKVMFLHVSVVLFTVRGGLPQGMLGYHPPIADTPPRAVHVGRCEQQAGGTHPTGMHSC